MRSQAGFTYIGVLLAVALVGVQLGVAGLVWSFVQERQKEQELLFIGNEFRVAIERFYLNPKGPDKEFPRKLDDLVRDPRYPGTVRHIRKIYADPITGKVRWKLITTPDCRILGVHSLSKKAPIKVGNFLRPADKRFEKKQQYSDWWFVYQVGNPNGRTPGAPGAAGANANAPPLPNASRISACPKIYSLEGDAGVDEEGNLAKTFTGSDILSGNSQNGTQNGGQGKDLLHPQGKDLSHQ
jgi:type II secretory pathway pseudopilin PulG